MERDCNKCVYSTRDGNCRKWTCEGAKTVNDIRADVIEEMRLKLEVELLMAMPGDMVKYVLLKVNKVLEQLKEQNK